MRLWFVTAAHGRHAVTRLGLTQRARLCAGLAGRGVEAHCVVIADDDNLDTAKSFGFDIIEMDNTQLGRKVNAGIRHGCLEGADWVCWCGADDWLHPWLFADLQPPDRSRVVLSGRWISIVDLEQPRLRELLVRTNVGAPPWIISRACLEESEYAPIRPNKNRGLDGSLVLGIGQPEWRFHDPRAHSRVDFKSAGSMTPYDVLGPLGVGDELHPWPELADAYGGELAEMAEATHRELTTVAA